MAPLSVSGEHAEARVSSFVRSVYNWMFIGLSITGLVAYYVSHNEPLMGIISGIPFLILGLILAELGLVIYISGMINRISAMTATNLFVLYSALNGITLSFIFLIYTQTSIVATFFICSATFLACSIYGWTTKKDLTSIGSFLMMGLFGIIIASVVNMFIRSSVTSLVISYIGVIVFIGLTAYDTQKLKRMALAQPDDLDAGIIRKGAIQGALSLYLDFINLFLMLLRIFGNSRN